MQFVDLGFQSSVKLSDFILEWKEKSKLTPFKTTEKGGKPQILKAQK